MMYHQKKYGYFQSGPRWRQPEPAPSPAPPFGPVVETVDIAELWEPATQFEASARVTGCALIASYNWLDRAVPSLLIPGAPPEWTPLRKPRRLAEDSGIYYRDKNAARYPSHPMEPAAQAVLAMHPEPLAKPVDVVGCGSTIGNLLRFVRGDERPFRMLVEVIGDAVHLIRRENSPTETIPSVRGFGHTFPEAYTTWDAGVRGSASHQRVLRYDFGGLSCIVRHEGDGYLRDRLGSSTTSSSKGAPPPGDEKSSVDALIEGLGASEMNSKTPRHSSQLSLQPGGFHVPQSAVFDLKTRSMSRKGNDFLGEELPRLWVAQIPNFILAYHERGTFTEIDVMDASEKVKGWEKLMNRELSRLAALLHRIVDLARASRDGRLEISRQTLATLNVREQCPGLSPPFSADVMVGWKAWLASEAGSGVSLADGKEKEEQGGFSWSFGDDDFTACSEKCSYCGKCTY